MSEKRQDRTNFCARCGVTFLWTREEQNQSSTNPLASRSDAASGEGTEAEPTTTRRTVRPQLCPGCRRLLPAEGRERGLVKWYNRRKRFGFITRKNQPDLFIHGSALQDSGPLYPDMLVEFGIQETDRGLAAAAVTRLSTSPHAAEDGEADTNERDD